MKTSRFVMLALSTVIAIGSYEAKSNAGTQAWGDTVFNCTDFLFDNDDQGPQPPFNESFQVTLNSHHRSEYGYYAQEQVYNGYWFGMRQEPSGTLAYLYINGGGNGVYRCHTQLPPFEIQGSSTKQPKGGGHAAYHPNHTGASTGKPSGATCTDNSECRSNDCYDLTVGGPLVGPFACR